MPVLFVSVARAFSVHRLRLRYPPEVARADSCQSDAPFMRLLSDRQESAPCRRMHRI